MSVRIRTPLSTHVFIMDTKRKLIGLIKEQRVLYNSYLSEYKDNASRNEAWKLVAEEMEMSVEECKTEWVRIRNSYVNALRRRVNHQTRTGKVLPPWIYEAELNFIKPFMTGRGWDDTPYTVLLRNQTEHIEDHAEEDNLSDNERANKTPKIETVSFLIDEEQMAEMEEYETSSKNNESSIPRGSLRESNIKIDESFNKSLQRYLNETSNPIKSNIVNELDESDIFFLGLSQTMKKLPKVEQCKLKMDMFKIMNEAEMKHLKGLMKRKTRTSSD